MAEAMQFHSYTINQIERRQEQMKILDKEIAKGLSMRRAVLYRASHRAISIPGHISPLKNYI